LSEAFEQKFGIRPVEGYGTTELSPLVSVNVPLSRAKNLNVECREGTVGRPVPGVSAKIVDPESFTELPLGESGMLLVKGPNVMKGYLGQPEETAKVIRDGWYVTGDIALIDTDGFIHITGRLSRFSKIGGEMVPHHRIEEAVQKILGQEEGELSVVVTSVPDEKKGERLIVVHTKLSKSPEEICRALAASGLPNLWIPDNDAFLEVESIPVLGSGKLDQVAVANLAKKHFGK
jgi:acyl-[acyl-carrier-protein]-phospholipid O-acyltransferase/long-chain-fatty-acid--[acyl-carrier-protein] ligase